MRKAGGYAFITNPTPSRINLGGLKTAFLTEGIAEYDTFSCCHCNRVVHTEAGAQADEYFCRNCMARICSPCADHPCIPFMKKIEEQEARDRKLRSIL